MGNSNNFLRRVKYLLEDYHLEAFESLVLLQGLREDFIITKQEGKEQRSVTHSN
jgi:hypothetical protein